MGKWFFLYLYFWGNIPFSDNCSNKFLQHQCKSIYTATNSNLSSAFPSGSKTKDNTLTTKLVRIAWRKRKGGLWIHNKLKEIMRSVSPTKWMLYNTIQEPSLSLEGKFVPFVLGLVDAMFFIAPYAAVLTSHFFSVYEFGYLSYRTRVIRTRSWIEPLINRTFY